MQGQLQTPQTLSVLKTQAVAKMKRVNTKHRHGKSERFYPITVTHKQNPTTYGGSLREALADVTRCNSTRHCQLQRSRRLATTLYDIQE